jgi:hypothetical protein
MYKIFMYDHTAGSAYQYCRLSVTGEDAEEE